MKHTMKQTMYVHASKKYNGTNEFDIDMKVCDMTEYGYILIGTVEVSADFDLPDDFNFTQAEIDSLKTQKSKIQAEAQMKITQIDEQIQRLQCIEYKDAS